MTDGGDGTKDDVKDKFAARFENEDSEDSGGSKKEKSSNKEKTEKKENTSKGSVTDWKNHSFYLPDELAEQLGSEYKRLDWQLDEHLNAEFKKTRHYYPLVVQLGLEQLEDLEPEEIADRI